MPQNRYDLEMQQGATFTLLLNIQNANTGLINLNSYAASMQIRKDYASNTVIESLSTANGEIVEGNTLGQYVFTLPAARTAAVQVNLREGGSPPKQVFVYDCSLQDGQGNVQKIIWGNINFYAQVTQNLP